MNDTFEKKVRAASIACWWVILIAAGFVTLHWLIYLAVISTQPEWVIAMWGPDVSWVFVQNVWFWAIAGLKFCVCLFAFAALWLTLWARQLRKLDRQGTK